MTLPGRADDSHARQCHRPAGRHPLARGPGHPRRHRAVGAGQLPPVPQQRRDRPGPGPPSPPASRTGPSSWFCRRRAHPDRAGEAVRGLEHDLPGRDQLEQIARGIATEEGELPEGDGLTAVLDAAAGLTRFEAEDAFSLSWSGTTAPPDVLWELKAQMLKKSGLLSLHRGGERFADLGGLEALKSFCPRACGRAGGPTPARACSCSRRPVGEIGIRKALGNETGRPTLMLDVGTLMGSLVGQSEERTRQALRIADAMAPCVILIDEIEKALSAAWPAPATAASCAGCSAPF